MQLIVYVIPAYIALMFVELVWGLTTGKNTYRLNDSISSLSLGLLSRAMVVCLQFFHMGIYFWVYQQFALPHASDFWMSWYGWVLLFFLNDFLEYWSHRISHESAFFWAVHVVHHQSQRFNLSTALRQASFGPISTFIFFVPLAFLGVSPSQYILIQTIVLTYQFWIHTEHITRMGWFDQVFNSPANHRVHHAINPEYLDKNYGAVLMVWDKIFGTYQQEQAPCVYGTTVALNSWNPVWANFAVFQHLLSKAKAQNRWRDKLRSFFNSPGWGESSSDTKPSPKPYNPKVPVWQQKVAGVLFLVSVVCTMTFLIQATTLDIWQSLGGLLVVTLELWAANGLLEKPIFKSQSSTDASI